MQGLATYLRGHPLRLVLLVAVMAGVGLFISRDALATSALGNFEIESALAPAPAAANQVYYSGNDSPPADDWVQNAGGTGVFLLSAAVPHTAFAGCYGSNIDVNPALVGIARFMCDGFGKDVGVPTPENNLVSPSGKIPDDIYPIKAGSLGAPKDDLTHGYYLQRLQNRNCNGGDASNHTIIIVGFERGNNEGDNHWGVELNQVPPTGIGNLVNNSSADFLLDFNRLVGDVFVSVDLTRGGSEPTITVMQVTGFAPDGDAIFASVAPVCSVPPAATTATNAIEQLAPPWNVIVCDPTTTDGGTNSCRIANQTGTGPADNACGNGQNKQDCKYVPPRDFVEVAVDLRAFGITQGCFADVIITTRSSPSGGGELGTADVKDIMASSLPPCSLQWEKRDDLGNLQGGATFTVDGASGPFACQGNAINPLVVVDDVDGTTLLTDVDKNPAAGQLQLNNVCPGTYTITETIAPTGFALDDDPTRLVVISATDPEQVVGTQGTADNCPDPTAGADSDESDFCNRLGTIEWEKRSDTGALLAGAQFTIAPNPFACWGGTAPGTITDDADNVDGNGTDKDGTGGQFKLVRVCLGNYTITESSPPPGFAADDDPTRDVTVSVADLNAVIGTQGSAQGCPDSTAGADSDESDFCNRLGTIEWEKRDDQGNLQGGATFTVGNTSGPFACQDADLIGADDANPVTVVDDTDGILGPGPDQDPAPGKLKLERVCLGTYNIIETVAPSGFALDDDTSRSITVSAAELNPVVGTQGTAQDCPDTTPASDGDETDFCNRLGSIQWEKRDDQNALQGGATFTVAATAPQTTGPFDCRGTAGTITVVDNTGQAGYVGNDTDATAGVLKIVRVCLGNYTITETVAPAGFALPADPDRDVTVSSATLNVVVGIAGNDAEDFHNRLGTIEWEKRLITTGGGSHPLQPGASFFVSPDPFNCHDGDLTNPSGVTIAFPNGHISVDDNILNDADTDGGQMKVLRVCLGTYTITEDQLPGSTLEDEDPTRVIIVSPSELTPVVGGTATPGSGQGNDDDSRATHGSGSCTDNECDFHNRQHSLIIKKVAKDASANPFTQPLAGACFDIAPNPFTGDAAALNVCDLTSLPNPDSAELDRFYLNGGLICLDKVIPGNYTITETATITGYLMDTSAHAGVASSLGSCTSRTVAATPDLTVTNIPLSKVTITFESLAGPGKTQLGAVITCSAPAPIGTVDDTDVDTTDLVAPFQFDDPVNDRSEVFTNLVPGVYTCIINIDP